MMGWVVDGPPTTSGDEGNKVVFSPQKKREKNKETIRKMVRMVQIDFKITTISFMTGQPTPPPGHVHPPEIAGLMIRAY